MVWLMTVLFIYLCTVLDTGPVFNCLWTNRKQATQFRIANSRKIINALQGNQLRVVGAS